MKLTDFDALSFDCYGTPHRLEYRPRRRTRSRGRALGDCNSTMRPCSRRIPRTRRAQRPSILA